MWGSLTVAPISDWLNEMFLGKSVQFKHILVWFEVCVHLLARSGRGNPKIFGHALNLPLVCLAKRKFCANVIEICNRMFDWKWALMQNNKSSLPGLTEVLQYSTSNMVTQLKYATD